ncbi:MAG: MGMT family protein [Nanoarchaeota archaeon]|nr:MGMT family protein [Nanoarchaeota archaeon]
MNFKEKCYTLLKKVPKGKVTTYKEIAEALNSKAYRAVGMAMKSNPHAPLVPCHRVISSNGKIGGYTSNNRINIQKKIKLLVSEGIEIKDNKINLEKFHYKFN